MADPIQRPARLRAEVWIVLGLSLGQSAVYAAMRIYVRLTSEAALGDQTASINTSLSPRPYVDLVYQVLAIAFAPTGKAREQADTVSTADSSRSLAAR